MSTNHSLSFVLLPTCTMASVDAFRLAWNDVTNGAAPPTQKKWDDTTAEVDLDGVTSIATLVPMPVPNQEAETAAARSMSAMRAGGFSPAPHRAHLLVASGSPAHSPVERLLRHTRIVAALVKACDATGIYEGGAHATHDPAFYLDVVANGPGLPLMLWNGIGLVRTRDTVELLTLGMAQLDLPDLLLVAPPSLGNEAMLFAFDVLGYVVARGGAIPEGQTVGRSAREKLPVTYLPSPIDPAVRVMRVELPRARKWWWPFRGR